MHNDDSTSQSRRHWCPGRQHIVANRTANQKAEQHTKHEAGMGLGDRVAGRVRPACRLGDSARDCVGSWGDCREKSNEWRWRSIGVLRCSHCRTTRQDTRIYGGFAMALEPSGRYTQCEHSSVDGRQLGRSGVAGRIRESRSEESTIFCNGHAR
jgi:hypothetical protein